MDDITRRLSMGAAAAGEKIYIEDVFSTWLYTGNGSTQTITNGIDLAGEGGMVWLKSRSAAENHFTVFDDSGTLKSVRPNQTSIAGTASWHTWNSNGFNLLTATNNTNEVTYASWTFRKAAKFFDVVTYVGDNSDNRQISHSLGSVPGAVIVKSISDTGNWGVWHRSLSSTDVNMFLNLNVAAASQSNFSLDGSASFTNSTFPVSYAGAGGLNTSGQTYVAYLFAHDAGGFGDSGNESVVSCGSFTTDGSGKVTVNLGWEPQWVMFKAVNNAQDWVIQDSMRGFNLSGGTTQLRPNLSDAEGGNSVDIAATSTGFTNTYAAGTSLFTNATYIYIAIRRGPMRTPTDATKVFDITSFTGNSNANVITSNVDMKGGGGRLYWSKIISGSNDGTGYCIMDDLRGASVYLDSTSTNGDISPANSDWGVQNFIKHNNWFYNSSSSTYIAWMFRRAPGFFDAVAYTGTGSTRAVSHNLKVVPELIVTKLRSSSGSSWGVDYVASNLGGFLNSDSAFSSGMLWNNGITNTSIGTTFAGAAINANGSTYIAYLFATCPGVSKVGSYTGTGSDINVDCGFTSGARFIIIKRTDVAITTGFETNWYVWDTVRGIVSGNDNSLELNTADPQKNNDWIDPLSSGFTVTSSAPPSLNESGGTYIFLAIA